MASRESWRRSTNWSDVLLGRALLFALPEVQGLLDLPTPRFPVNANLNGLFALAVGAGYFAVWRRPADFGWYFWIMGVCLKGGGTLFLILDQVLRGSPPAFLLVAVTDGTLAVLTLYALTRRRRGPGAVPARTR